MSGKSPGLETGPYDVLVLGAGYAGLMAALRLRGRAGWPSRIGLVNERDAFVERVRLQEAIIEPVAERIPSLSALVAGTNVELIQGRVRSLDPVARHIEAATEAGDRRIGFERLIYALGSSIDQDSVAGVAEHAFRLDPTPARRSVAALRRRLHLRGDAPGHVVVVGGGETGVEVAGEIRTAWASTAVTMVSSTRCGDFKGDRVAAAVRGELTRLGVTLIDHQTVCEVRHDRVLLAGGGEIACDDCIWSGGLRASPIAKVAGLATDPADRIWVDPMLRSISHAHILAVGDAARPIAPTGAPYRRSAFAALNSGAYAADAVQAERTGRRIRPFAFSTFGQGVAIGGVGVGITTFPDDRPVLGLIRGRAGIRVRNLFVWLLTQLLKLERRRPGAYVIVGRNRVSWPDATQAMREAGVLQTAAVTGRPDPAA